MRCRNRRGAAIPSSWPSSDPTVFIIKWLVAIVMLPMRAAAEDVQELAPLQAVVAPMSLNSIDKGEVLVFLHDGDVLLRVDDLTNAGVRDMKGARREYNGDQVVSLRSLAPSVTYSFDEQTLTLTVTASPDCLAPTTITLGTSRPSGLRLARDNSLLINYAINWVSSTGLDGFVEGAYSSSLGLMYGSLFRTPLGAVVRGPTYFIYDDVESLTRWTLGDSQAGTGLLGGSALFAGISVARRFEIDPYFYRQPGHTISGSVLTPSTVEIYNNGVFLRREYLPPGPFQIANLQVPTGSGSVQMIMRDALGQQTEVVSPFYFAGSLLAPGVSEYSVNLGAIRTDPLKSFAYRTPVLFGFYRRGANESVTIGGRLEATPRMVSAGSTLSVGLPFGEMELATALSFRDNQHGFGGAVLFTRSSRTLSFGGSLRAQTPKYANLDTTDLESNPLDVGAFISFPSPWGPSLSLQYFLGVDSDHDIVHQVSSVVTWQLDKLSFFLSADLAFDSGTSTKAAFFGICYALPAGTTGAVSYQTGESSAASLQIQKPLPPGEGFGYRGEAQAFADGAVTRASLQYQWPYGRYEAGYENVRGENGGSLSATGALVWLDGSILPSRPVGSGFALVRLPAAANVSVFLDNQEVGRTNGRGELLLPALLPYYANRVRIRDADLPFDYEIEQAEVVVAPPYRGGALVAPVVRKTQAIVGQVVIEAQGRDLVPAYGDLTVVTQDRSLTSPLGVNAEFYLQDVPPGSYPATIHYRGVDCAVSLDVPREQQQFINLGVVRCAQTAE